MTGLRGPARHRSPGLATLRIIFYYVVLAGVLGVLLYKYPNLVYSLSNDVAQAPGSDEILRTFGGEPVSLPVPTGFQSMQVTAIALLGCLLIMIPSTWAYILIKRDSGYEESVVHTLIILPIVVAGVVIIVQSSLALAFSLAGIVAAVRFRTTLNDTKDAVYVFMAIGVGLAAGTTRLGVALVLSIVFNVVNLFLWRVEFGNPYVDQLHRTGGLGLGTAIAGPASSKSALGFGDQSAMDAVAPTNLDEVAEAQARMRQYLKEESGIAKERKRYRALLIYTNNPAGVQDVVEPVLEVQSMRWQLAEIVPGDGGVSAMTYLVRLNEGVDDGTLLRLVEGADGMGVTRSVQAAEVRSLKGLAETS